MVKVFTRSITGCACILLSAGYISEFINLVMAAIRGGGNANLLFFAGGFLLFSSVWIFIRQRMSFFCTGIHEKTHALFQVLSGHKPQEMFISADAGGYVMGTGGNIIVCLAPYFFPYMAIAFLLIFNVIKPEFHNPYFFILGVLVSFHLTTSITDYITQIQAGEGSDINRVGWPYATSIIVFVNILIYGSILAFVSGGMLGVKDFITGGFNIIMEHLCIGLSSPH